MRLLYRFHLVIILPTVLCLVVLSAFLYQLSSRALIKEKDRALQLSVWHARHLMEASLNRVKNDISTLLAGRLLEKYFMYADVGEHDYVEDVRATLEESFLAVSRNRSEYASLRIFTTTGEGIVNITDQRYNYHLPDISRAEWFSSSLSLEPGVFHVSRVMPCEEHQLPSITTSLLWFHHGKPRAVVSIQIHCQTFFGPVLREIGLGRDSRIMLVDSQGNILAHDDVVSPARKNLASGFIDNLDSSRGSVMSWATGPDNDHLRFTSLALHSTDAILFATQPLIGAMTSSSDLKARLAGITLVVALCLIIFIFYAVRSITGPLEDLERTTREIARGHLGARAGTTGKDEIGSLACSLNQMADTLQKGHNELKDEILERRKAQQDREKLIAELKNALAQVKTLSGFLPICASCKKIRDDQGYWNQIEIYIRERSNAEFSHGICPECAKKFYPDFAQRQQE